MKTFTDAGCTSEELLNADCLDEALSNLTDLSSEHSQYIETGLNNDNPEEGEVGEGGEVEAKENAKRRIKQKGCFDYLIITVH